MLDKSTAILIAAGLIMVAGFTTVLAYRFGAPLLLVFLGLGLLVGEDGLGIQFDDASLAYLIGSLALAVILFDSGFRTRFASFRVAALPAVTLATVGVVLTAGLVGLAARFIFGLPWLESFLDGEPSSARLTSRRRFFCCASAAFHTRARPRHVGDRVWRERPRWAFF